MEKKFYVMDNELNRFALIKNEIQSIHITASSRELRDEFLSATEVYLKLLRETR